MEVFMKIQILEYTKNPLTRIGTNASYCYNTKLKDENHAKRIAINCINGGHGRNMEFADVTMKISGISARMGREFGRHIIGVSYVQSSTRYINYKNFEYHIPTGLNEEQLSIYNDTMETINRNYIKLKELGCKNDITGYLLPLSMETELVVKINVRALEHMFELRECTRALLEFRMFMRLLKNELSKLDDEWKWLCDNTFQVKCKKYGYCTEEKCCGLYPKKDDLFKSK